MASIYLFQAIDPVAVSVLSGSGSIPTSISLPCSNGQLFVRKQRYLGGPGDLVTASCGINVSHDNTLPNPVNLEIFGLPSIAIATVTLGAGPPPYVRFSFADGQVLDIEFNSPSGNISYVNSGLTTIQDLSVAVSVAILE